MKTKLLLIFLLLTSYCLLSTGQVPQGFNYQAIAREGVNPITSPIGVKITIQSASGGGTVFWVEEHLSVQPNSSGLFSLVIGEGTRLSGTATTFSGIDWTVTPKFIKTDINNGGGYVTMGTSQLWSVPYSTVAGDLKGTLDKLSVKGETANVEEALFEVKNKDGQTILAVYNEGVRIYVADGSKGSKGGFAIGGFGAAKTDTPGQQYFVVNRDSIRAYIFDDPLVKAPKGGFAIGGFGPAKTFTNDYLMISPDSARIYINNASSTKGKKGGFAVGGFGAAKRTDPQKLFTVSDDSIRLYIDDGAKGSKGGFAIGGFGSAKGVYKNFMNVATDATGIVNPAQNRILWYPVKNAFLTGQVLIHHPDSIGINSTTTGYESRAKGAYSQAMGYKSIARGQYSTAIGKNAIAHKDNSFAFGDAAKAFNIDSYAFGAGAVASSPGSFAFGSYGRDTATFVPNTQPTLASGNYSFAIGLGAVASGSSSTALGINSNASGDASMALGVTSNAQGDKSVALVAGLAIGRYSFAAGLMSKAEGDYSVAIGRGITKFGGVYNHASGYGSVAIGYSRAYGYSSVAIGTATVNSDYGLGMGNSATVNGDYATGIGTLVTAESLRSFVVGTNNIVSGSRTEWLLTDPLFVVGNGTSPSTQSNAFTVLKNGNTGINTATPQYTVESFGTNAALIANYSGNSRGGVAALTTDRIALLTTTSTDDIVFGYTSSIHANFSTSFVQRMKIDNGTGNVGIGVASPFYRLDVGGSLKVSGPVILSDPYARPITSAIDLYINAAGEVGYLSSSINYKDNVFNLTGYNWLYDLRPVLYNYKNSDPADIQYGLIAEEVDKVNPLLVIYGSDKKPDGLMYERLTVPMLKAIQEQKKVIESQNERIARLEDLVEQMQIVMENSK